MLRHGLRLPVRRTSVRCTRSISATRYRDDALLGTPAHRPDDAGGISRPRYQPLPRFPRDGSYDWLHMDMHVYTLLAAQAFKPWWFARELVDLPFESHILHQTRKSARVSREEYNFWRPVAVAARFPDAVSLLKQRAEKAPDWLLFHMYCNRTRSMGDAVLAMDTLLAMQSELEPDTFAGCAITTIHALVQFHAGALTRSVISAFLHPDIFAHVSPFYVNAMLLAVSRCPESEVLAPLISQLVSALHARGVQLESFVVSRLLSSKSNSLELTQRVHRILMTGAPNAVDRAMVYDYITVLQKEGAPGSVALVLTALISDETAVVADVAPGPADAPAVAFPPHFPPHLPAESFLKMTVFEWISYVAQAARDKNVTAETLLEVYAFAQQCVSRDAAHRHSNLSSIRRKLFPALLAGLVRRGEAARAVTLWDEYVARHLDPASSADPLKLDRHILGAGVHALSHAGHVGEALETLDALALRVGEAGYAGGRSAYDYPSYDPGSDVPRPRVPLSVIALNAFLGALLNARRPDAVFALWDVMEPTWGTVPDQRTLDVLLMAASLAGRIHAESPVREELAYIRFRMRALLPWGRRRADPIGARGSDDDPVKMVRALLAERQVQSTLWRGAPAWQRARYIFRSVVLGNWPELAAVVPPAHALREGEPVEFAYGDRDPASWHVARTAGATEAPDETDGAQTSAPAPAPAPRSASTLLYPATTPSAKTFHLYIVLLGQSGLASEIAQALAWMRQLGLVPTTDTIAMALVYWRTVTDDAPSVEIYKDLVNRKKKADEPPADALYGSQYITLVQWLTDWVPRRMPTEGQLRALDHFARGIIHHETQELP
ncbi:hypothetical protein AURDEDRAFT_145082 [Auricularia subglabra TFB-10046 SS5]|uniref:Uncharacterized protein n=1 Tax=Auricularia subglabra (strain TFB-10046 / SS5) TaxID=717982 RepID=J0DDJ2_AURST|nr:hypothetical protein AURDEDRAFT_145082 [Auricularia subglabra TFB-10046 SS5]